MAAEITLPDLRILARRSVRPGASSRPTLASLATKQRENLLSGPMPAPAERLWLPTHRLAQATEPNVPMIFDNTHRLKELRNGFLNIGVAPVFLTQNRTARTVLLQEQRPKLGSRFGLSFGATSVMRSPLPEPKQFLPAWFEKLAIPRKCFRDLAHPDVIPMRLLLRPRAI